MIWHHAYNESVEIHWAETFDGAGFLRELADKLDQNRGLFLHTVTNTGDVFQAFLGKPL